MSKAEESIRALVAGEKFKELAFVRLNIREREISIF